MSKKPNNYMAFMWIFVFIIAIIFYYLAYITTRQIHSPMPNNRQEIAIVSMMKAPKNLDTWLKHHRDMGIRRFYIRLEDTPNLESSLRNMPDVNLQIGKSTGQNEYTEIQVRQRIFMNDSIQMAKKHGMAWIIHIDSDELLMGDLNEIRQLPENVRTFWMQNEEAKYDKIPRSNDNCFAASKFYNCAIHKEQCVSYGNGKGGGRAADDVQEFGPHRFKSTRILSREAKVNIIVQHYESCDFEIYKNKYKQLANQDEDTRDKIPFNYYKESIDAAKEPGDEALERVFMKYRLEN